MEVNERAQELIDQADLSKIDYDKLARQQAAYVEKLAIQLQHEMPLELDLRLRAKKSREEDKQSFLVTQRTIASCLGNLKAIRALQKVEKPTDNDEDSEQAKQENALIEKARAMMK